MTTLDLDPVFFHLVPFLKGLSHRPRIIEIGMSNGKHSNLLRAFCQQPPFYWGYEPDPRNLEILRDGGHAPFPWAIGATAGRQQLYLSSGSPPGGSQEHTDSSSLKRPTGHLEQHPWCRFDQQVEVVVFPLDAVVPMDGYFDLVWCDVQGAQLDVIAGGRHTLSRTTLLYIELHPEPLYEGEPASLEELQQELAEQTEFGWSVVQQYPSDVLLRRENGQSSRGA